MVVASAVRRLSIGDKMFWLSNQTDGVAETTTVGLPAPLTAKLRRVSWGAIIAGIVAALAI